MDGLHKTLVELDIPLVFVFDSFSLEDEDDERLFELRDRTPIRRKAWRKLATINEVISFSCWIELINWRDDFP